ncbi:hypothetical protein J2R62_19175, partial [Plesiomonas shigelloides]
FSENNVWKHGATGATGFSRLSLGFCCLWSTRFLQITLNRAAPVGVLLAANKSLSTGTALQAEES